MAPDGKVVAVVVKRAITETSRYGASFLDGNDRADIWLLDERGRARNLTHGERDSSGHFNPVWSPDGRRLAFASTRGGDNVFLYTWDRETDRIRRLTERGVTTITNGSGYLVQWVDDRRLLAPLVAPGEFTLEYGQWLETQRRAPSLWEDVESGDEPTAGVLDSSQHQAAAELDEDLALIDTVAGTVELIAPTRQYAAGNVVAGRNGRYVARLDDLGPTPPVADQPRGILERRTQLAVVSLATGAARLVPGVPNPGIRAQPRWSPDGSELLVLGTPNGRADDRATPYLVNAATGVATSLDGGAISATGLIWGAGIPVVRGYPTDGGQGRARQDWWAFDQDRPAATPRNLTAGFATPPPSLIPVPGGLVGVADGAAWLIDPRTGATHELGRPSGAPLQGMVWPFSDGIRWRGVRPTNRALAEARGPRLDREFSRIVVQDADGGLHQVDPTVDPTSGTALRPLPRPAGGHAGSPVLVGYSPATGLAVYELVADHGTTVWTGRGNRFTPRLTLNRHLARVRAGDRRLISYRGPDGREHHGALLLPPTRRTGQPHPLIVSVYGTRVITRAEDAWEFNLNNPTYENHQLLAAKGYAVLIPSIPKPAGEEGAEPATWPTPYVQAAVDAAIATGVADPDRLAVMGHSFGGYNVNCLITQTDRFKAAISISGFANVLSTYGVFDARFRHTDRAQEWFGPAYVEDPAFEFGLQSLPWTDPQRYLRNSPLVAAGEITTPLLLIHGEFDFLSMTAAEEMYTALARQAKPARLVRYWGEGHMPASMHSPANFRHMLDQQLDWLDTYVRSPATDARTR